jgi:hypothetical protein
MMNYRMQFSPMSSTHQTRLATWEDIKFFRSWLVYDSDLEATRTRGRVNWNMVGGFVLVAVISAGGWFGISLIARHLLK